MSSRNYQRTRTNNRKFEQSYAPAPRISRSKYDMSFNRTMPMKVDLLYPMLVRELLPAETFSLNQMKVYGRLLSPLDVPMLDMLHFSAYAFKVPARIVWRHWVNFMGEKLSPSDTTEYICPQILSDKGFDFGSIFDHMNIAPGVPQTRLKNSLALRCYNKIIYDWFWEQNLQEPPELNYDSDGPDLESDYNLWPKSKYRDLFSSCLPFTQKGPAITIPLGDSAPVSFTNPLLTIDAAASANLGLNSNAMYVKRVDGTNVPANTAIGTGTGTASPRSPMSATGTATTPATGTTGLKIDNLVGDLSNVQAIADLQSASGINLDDFRALVQLQNFYQMKGVIGTRYTESLFGDFDVVSPDARQQRSEFLGSARWILQQNIVPQTSETSATSPQAYLASYMTMANSDLRFTASTTEHEYLIILGCITAELNYQQGMPKMFDRSEMLDFAFPVFSHLSEQPVKNSEIFYQGESVLDSDGKLVDDGTFGYNEIYSQYRYPLNEITGEFRAQSVDSSGNPNTLAYYHLAEEFGDLPKLNADFIRYNTPIERVIKLVDEQQFLIQASYNISHVRPLPTYSRPGYMDHNPLLRRF